MIKLVLYLATFLLTQAQICEQKHGCILAFKALTYLPSTGVTKNYDNVFNLKVILVFEDKISVFDDNQHTLDYPNVLLVIQVLHKSQFVRNYSYSQLIIGCKKLRARICPVRYFVDVNENTFEEQVMKRMGDNGADFNTDCFLVGLISLRVSEENLLYICESVQSRVIELKKNLTIMGRFIMKYKYLGLTDKSSATNSNIQYSNLIRVPDTIDQFKTIYLVMKPFAIEGYSESNNNHFLIFKHQIRDITHVQQVSDAIEKQTLDINWSANFNPKPVPSCCFFLEIREYDKQYYCVYFKDFTSFSYQSCDYEVKKWLFYFNKLMNEQKLSVAIQKLSRNKEPINCQDQYMKFLLFLVDRNTEAYDILCSMNQQYDKTYNKNRCEQEKMSDYLSEIQLLSIDNDNVNDSLVRCSKNQLPS